MSHIAQTTLESPYPGLRPFQSHEAALFFGRAEQTDAMLSKLESTRFLAVVGASGTGKSSLVRAGLLPAIADGFLRNAPREWTFAIMRPGMDPFGHLAEALCRALGSAGRAPTAFELSLAESMLRSGRLGVVELLEKAPFPGAKHLLILVDQFEELFRFRGDMIAEKSALDASRRRNDAIAFVNLLLKTASQEARPVYVVLTMRSDFMGDCDAFYGLPEAISDSQFLTPRLTREQLTEAIEEPLAQFNAVIEKELVTAIINEIGSDPDQLPLMQHCLMRLWLSAEEKASANGRHPVQLRLDEYHLLGGLEKTLDRHGDVVFATLTDVQKAIARILIQCLSERDTKNARSGGRDIRRPTSLDTVRQVADVSWEAVRDVVEIFRKPGVNFLMPPPGTPLRPTSTLDVSHESLLRRWKLAQDWIDAESKSAETYRRLRERALSWRQDDKNEDELLPRLQVENARDWWEHEKPTKAWARRYADAASDPAGASFDLVMEYLEASDQQQDRKRSRKKRKNILLACGVAVVLVIVAFLYSAKHLSDQKQEILASYAGKEKKLAKDAKESLERAQEETRKARALALVGASREAGRIQKPVESALFAVEALNLVPAAKEQKTIDWADTNLTAERSLRDALAGVGGRGFYADVGDVTRVAMRAGNTDQGRREIQWLAAAGTKGKIHLWRLSALKREPAIRPCDLAVGFNAAVNGLFFTNDGKFLVAHSSENNGFARVNPLFNSPSHWITIWDLANLARPPRLFEAFANLHASPDGKWLETDDGNNHVRFLLLHEKLDAIMATDDVLTDENAGPWIRSTSICGNGACFVRITSNGTAFLWDTSVRGAAPKHQILTGPAAADSGKAPLSLARSGEFSKQGDRLFVFMNNYTARIWQKKGEAWPSKAEDVDLKKLAGLAAAQAVVTSFDESVAVLIPLSDIKAKSAGPTPFVPPATTALTGYCFNINRPDWTKPIRLANFGDADWSRGCRLDESRRWLYAHDHLGQLIFWDLQADERSEIAPRRLQSRSFYTIETAWPIGPYVVDAYAAAVRLWDLRILDATSASQLPLEYSLTLNGAPPGTRSYAMSQEGGWLAIGGQDGMVRVWSLNPLSVSAEPVVNWDPSPGSHLLSTPDKNWLMHALPDGSLRLRSVNGDESPTDPDATVPRPAGAEANLLQSDDGHWLLAVRSDLGSADLWFLGGATKPSRLCKLEVGPNPVTQILVDRDKKWIAIHTAGAKAMADKTLLWRLAPLSKLGKQDAAVSRPANIVLAGKLLTFIENGQAALTLDESGQFARWMLKAGAAKHVDLNMEVPANLRSVVTVPEREELILISAEQKNADLRTGVNVYGFRPAETRRFHGGNYEWREAFLSKGGRFLCVLSKKKVQAAPVVQKDEAANKENQTDRPQYFELRRNQPSPIDICEDRKIKGEYVEILKESPDRRWVLTHVKSINQVARCVLWDFAPASEKDPPRPFPMPDFDSFVYTSDSAWLVCVVRGTLNVFNLKGDSPTPTGAEIAYPANYIRLAALSAPDGRWLAVMDKDSSISVWDRQNRVMDRPTILPPGPVPFEPHDLVWRADGKKLFTIGYLGKSQAKTGPTGLKKNNVLCEANVNLDELRTKAKRVVGRNLYKSDWQQLKLVDFKTFKAAEYRKTFDSLPAPTPRIKSPTFAVSAKRDFDDHLQETSDNLARAKDHYQAKGQKNKLAKYYKYRFDARKTYIVEMSADPTILDSYLFLLGPDGTELAHDDDSGATSTNYFDARIVFPCVASGEYTVIATTLPGTFKGEGPYRLRVGWIDTPKEQDIELTTPVVETKATLTTHETAYGLGKPFKVALPAGKICQIDLSSPGAASVLAIQDLDGTPLAFANSNNAGTARILFTNTKAATYRIVVSTRAAAAVEVDLKITLP